MGRNTQVHSSDEIDLGELLLKLTQIISRNRVMIILLSIVGTGAGAFYYSIKAPVYESSMMLRSDILTEAYSETLTDNLKKLIDERSYELLATKLSITPEQAAQLVDIKVESIEDSSGPEGAVKNFIFLISVETKDNSILSDLQIGIISFLENNEFVKRRIDLRRERYKALISEMKSEANELDSLKKQINKGLINSGSNLVLLDPSKIYEQALKTYKEELSLQSSLALIESIQLIEDFTAFNRPMRPRLVPSLISGLGIALLLAIGLILFIETRNYLKSIGNS
ncbi:MAG: Wzz/FepE/Etk N-terminal domain-containing protein [Bacteroidota bacterium]